MEDSFKTSYDDIVQVVDIANFRKHFFIEDESNTLDKESVETLLLLEQCEHKISNNDDDFCLQRLSLAYERLHSMPRILLEEIAPQLEILDISHNEFENLDFLKEFKQLTSLICDHNTITSDTILPYLPKLELLWMNHCKIQELVPWARKLQKSCPNLKYLSLMGNPLMLSYPIGDGVHEQVDYRSFIISLFPNLSYLDDKPVIKHHKEAPQKKNYCPLTIHVAVSKPREKSINLEEDNT
ncbi:hypothetical protein JTB14_029591 [Gonioctena quinquepunctata]|nr:hypothetical protein JTB14_029591 [Gonioctena quinquepunctata]